MKFILSVMTFGPERVVRFERCHLERYGESGMCYGKIESEVVYVKRDSNTWGMEIYTYKLRLVLFFGTEHPTVELDWINQVEVE